MNVDALSELLEPISHDARENDFEFGDGKGRIQAFGMTLWEWNELN